MFRFIANLLATDDTTTKSRKGGKAKLQMESLETRETPAARPGANPHANFAAGEQSKSKIVYTVDLDDTGTSKTEKRIAKKNTLAAKDLAPGNYSVSYHTPAQTGHKIVLHGTKV